MEPRVLYAVDNGLVVVTLNRPERRNAIDAAATAELREALDRFEADERLRVAILTGSGDRAFCAGMDLKAFAAGEGAAIIEGRGGFAGFTAYPRTKPVIAAVNGAALGGGCEIVLACDLVVAAEGAVLGLPEVKRGLFAASGGALRLPAMIPRVRAMELLLTGDTVDAATALGLGLVNRVVPAALLLDEARALARRISANAPLSIQATLAVSRAATGPSEALWSTCDSEWYRIARSEDAREGPAAFAEKRPPRWRGR
jgi:enoyl-CoA hydratase/carnithine racemase